MKTFAPPAWPKLKGEFHIHHHGKIHVSEESVWFGFQIRAAYSIPQPSLVFTLHQEPASTKGKPVQFGVRIDLETGEIWDIANEGGVIGWLEKDALINGDGEYPIVLRWEVEHTGGALIPRLHVGDEEWLYPSLLFPSDSHFVAMTGHNMKNVSNSTVFSPGYVWCQDRLK